jgi:lauroyl/myristoyl acyltransferase
MRASNFASLAERISKLRAQAGGFCFGEMHIHNLEALAYWVHDKQCRNEEIVARDFTIAVLDECQSMVDT